jgi:hypothetical protein
MRHLYNSRVEVLRLEGTFAVGTLTQSWTVAGALDCRLDLTFVRPGKDQPMPVVGGRAPDRIGVLYFDVGEDVRAGDRIRPVSGPLSGIFEVRVVPDPAVAFSTAHHMEVQIVEVSQNLTNVFPGSQPEEGSP